MADPDSLRKLQQDYSAVFKKVIAQVGRKIVNYSLPIYVLNTDSADDESTYEKIAEIFTRVNSAGVKIGNLEMFFSFFAAAFPRKEKDRVIALHEKLSESFELDLEPLVRFTFSCLGVSQYQLTRVASFRKGMATLRERYAGKPKAIGLVLSRVGIATSVVLEMLGEDLGIASSQYLPSQDAFLPLFDFAFTRGFKSLNDIPKRERRHMQYWLLVGSFKVVYPTSPNGKIQADSETIRGCKGAFPLEKMLRAMKDRPPRANVITKGNITDCYINVLRGRTGSGYLMRFGSPRRTTRWTSCRFGIPVWCCLVYFV